MPIESKPEEHAEDPDLEETEGLYRIEVRADAGLIPEEEHDFIDEYEGDLLFDDGFDEPRRAGEFRATVVRVADALGAGIPLHDLWDYSSELYHIYLALYDQRTGDFRRKLEGQFDLQGLDVLVLNTIGVRPAHRGRNLGLAVASRLIDLLARGCGLVVCQPSPLQFCELHTRDPRKREELGLDALERDRDAAFRKLRRYWSRLGFEKIRGQEDYYALSPALVRPKISTLCPLLH